MDVLWKGMLGGVVTALIVLASKRGNVLPGILPLAPTFAVIALFAVGAKGDPEGFRATCIAGAKGLPIYLVFLASCYILIGRFDYRVAVLGGLAVWLVMALAVFVAPRYL